MVNNKILTISIAAYNVEKFIENTLDSLICNRMDKLEVIIENDGSKDKTAELAQKYVDKYPGTFILNNKPNGGYGSTINASLDIATGKYFKQLDGDDWFDTKNLDAFIDLLEKVDTDCVFSAFTEKYENGKSIFKSLDDYLKIGKYNIGDVMKYSEMFLIMHCLTFKVELLRNINLRILENCFYTDVEYVLYPILHVKDVYITNLNIYDYRLGLEGQSVSIVGIKKHYQEHCRVIKQVLTHYEEIQNCDDITKKEVINRIYTLIVRQYIFYLIADKSQKTKEQLVEFDKYIKNNYPDLYKIPNKYNDKSVKILRLTKFLTYGILSDLINK